MVGIYTLVHSFPWRYEIGFIVMGVVMFGANSTHLVAGLEEREGGSKSLLHKSLPYRWRGGQTVLVWTR